MKIQSITNHLFPGRKNVVFALFFAFICFFGGASNASAENAGVVGNAIIGIGQGVIDGVSSIAGITADGIFKPIALGLISLEAALVNAAAIIFTLVLNPDFFLAFMNNPVIYEIWKIVRDTMNMLFILILLFSAFATIYQISKYRYDKIIWTVILMALLVNFSWPIARTIVDFFNSMMYFFVQSLFHTSGKQAAEGILSVMNLRDIFLPDGDASDWPHILLAILTLGIFAFTLLRLALFMLIRLVALPILVMVSPIGFAGMAMPAMQKRAQEWWNSLFKYASYGPLVVFQVLAALAILKNVQ